MDDIKTGTFEISTAFNEFWQDWQVELAKEDLKRRARTACERVQRDGVPYVTCLYPIEKRDGKLTLKGFFTLLWWGDCEIGEAVLIEEYNEVNWQHIENKLGIRFELEAKTARNFYEMSIYRRVQ